MDDGVCVDGMVDDNVTLDSTVNDDAVWWV